MHKKSKLLVEQTLLSMNLKKKAREFFYLFPNAENVLVAVAYHVSDRIHMKNGQQLFEACVVNAFAVTSVSKPHPLSDFIAGLLYFTPRLVEVRVCLADKRTVWEPFIEPLGAFISRHNDEGILVIEEPLITDGISANVVRSMIASRILSVGDIHTIGGDINGMFGSRNNMIETEIAA